MSLSLVCLNIEGSKHLERVLPFFESMRPDVACVQEVCERDIPALEKILGVGVFAPKFLYPEEGMQTAGTAIFSRVPIKSQQMKYYRGAPGELPVFDKTSTATKYETEHSIFQYCDIEKDDETYRIGTTHFTWTPNGLPDDYQRADLKKLLPILEEAGEIVFCGDFNAPRGGEIFAALAKRYKDNIPEKYTWSLDLDIHRNGGGQLQDNAKKAGFAGFVVDGLFTTPSYKASNVELVNGVSDHCAIVATISKA